MAYLVNVTWGLPLAAAIVFAMAATALLGLLSERLMWGPMRAKGPSARRWSSVSDDPPGGALLEVEGVVKRFGGIHAVDGAGKTTLFNAITGFQRVDRGSARLAGEEVLHLPATRSPAAAWCGPSRSPGRWRRCR